MIRALAVLGLGAMLVGCGVQKIAEDTQLAVQKGNDTQAELLEQSRLLAELTKKLLEHTTVTTDGIHLQTLSSSLAGLLDPKNTEVLSPPNRMMPFARTFGKEATPKELVETMHLLHTAAIFSPSGSEAVRTVSLVAAGALAGLAPEEKMEDVIFDQIVSEGRYVDAARRASVSRYYFIRDYLFNNIVEQGEVMNIGTLQWAVDYYEQMKSVVQSPYVDSFIFQIPDLGLDASIDASDLDTNARKAVRRFEDDLPAATLVKAEVQALLARFN